MFFTSSTSTFSNDHIQKFLKSVNLGKYKYLIITEHLPKEEGYFKTSNIDKITGPNIKFKAIAV